MYQGPGSRVNENGVGAGWAKGAYVCKCRQGFYSVSHHQSGFNGSLVEGQNQLLILIVCYVFNPSLIFITAAWKEMKENKSNSYEKVFLCLRCAPGCARCKGPEPCLATYNWPFRYSQIAWIFFISLFDVVISIVHYFLRISLLAVSIFCAFGTIVLVAYMYQHRKLKVFKVASPIFLSITLLGCALMYLEVGREALYPLLFIFF